MIAVGVTMALAASGAALAKPHDEHPGNGHGHGKSGGDDDRGPNLGAGNGMGGGNGKGGGNGGGSVECDPVVLDAIRATVDATCPCAGTDDGSGGVAPWKNHGKYVRCVAHAVRAELKAAGLKRRCLRGAVPCAAQSACGKRGAEPCITATPDTCVGGACTNDPTTLCAVDADCTVLACGVTDPDDCTAAGGVVRSESCCFGSPSGAFVDGAELF